MKLALGVEYNGTCFHGWQSQHRLATIQHSLEQALSKVANESIKVFCAGRTDSGVHATHQVIHFETKAIREDMAWIFGTNSHLPDAISIQWVKLVDDSFHARFSALSRRYQYVIYNKQVRSSLYAGMTAWVHQSLDVEKMQAGAKNLIGEHDFSSFRSADCQSRTPKRHVFAVNVWRQGPLVVIDIVANSFLHHMVRNIVGVLLEIGGSRKDPTWCQALLEAKDRRLASKTAPPQGLYLTGVRYSDHYEIMTDFKSAPILGK